MNISDYNGECTGNTLSYFVAPYEADAQVVYLAETCNRPAAILSTDGDFLVYAGALDIVVSNHKLLLYEMVAKLFTQRILKVDWEKESITGHVTKKADLLKLLIC